MAKTDYQTIDQYHAAFSGDTLGRMQQIRSIIKQAAPEAEEVISYQIPAFKIGKKFLIYYSAYAKHITLSSPWSEPFLLHFAEELKAYKVTKSAIQLQDSKELPIDFIKRIVVFRKEEIS